MLQKRYNLEDQGDERKQGQYSEDRNSGNWVRSGPAIWPHSTHVKTLCEAEHPMDASVWWRKYEDRTVLWWVAVPLLTVLIHVHTVSKRWSRNIMKKRM